MEHRDVEQVAGRLDRAVQRLTKWRSVFAGWQLGTRSDRDGECRAVRDHREVTILLRAEVNALTKLLLDKGVCTQVELSEAIAGEAEHLDREYAKRFPGFASRDDGMAIDARAAETMQRLGFPS